MQSVMILGRQPALGLAELESLFGARSLHPVGDTAVIVDRKPEDIDFHRLGGSIKCCKLLTCLDTTDWRSIESYISKMIPEHVGYLPEGKMQLGLSVYGIRVSTQQLLATGLTFKKIIKKTGRSVRLVPNKELELNSASVLHNNLTGPTGWELVFIQNGSQTIIAQTVAVQDIESYTVRDRERPMRDARVGMLPPKLAQIIINLALDKALTPSDIGVLDPFCGTGVVLQEALLAGYSAYGTDLEPRMIDYSKTNMEWLLRTFNPRASATICEVGDATNHHWQPIFSTVAAETYLGRPFTTLPSPDILNQTVNECNTILTKFLGNMGSQIKPGTRLCLAIPAWQTHAGQFTQLPLLDSLEDMGYNRISFEHARNRDLIYYRADQIVARELLTLVKL